MMEAVQAASVPAGGRPCTSSGLAGVPPKRYLQADQQNAREATAGTAQKPFKQLLGRQKTATPLLPR